MRSRIAIIGLAGLAVSCVALAVMVKPSDSTASACAGRATGTLHQVTISQAKLSQAHTTAQLCDRLEITNQDSKSRLVAFGKHEHHVTYDGVEERLLKQGEHLTITLDQVGDFTFHDHFQDEVQGFFTVLDK
jgi:hypothetical protein